MKNKIIYINLIVLGLTLTMSCKKDFLEKAPLSKITEDNFYKTEADMQQALNVVYSALGKNNFYGGNNGAGGLERTIGLASDDVTYSETVAEDVKIDNFIWDGSMGSWTSIWTNCWQGIQRANILIEKMDLNKDAVKSEDTRAKIIGQAKFLRAFYYWNLVTLYGEIPVYTTVPKTVDDMYKPQVTLNEAYAQIQLDLNDASLLPESWSGADLGRVTKWSARALLGKHYLYIKDWTNAAAVLGDVVANSKKSLMPKFEQNLNRAFENNAESLFEVQYQSGIPSGTEIGKFFEDGGISVAGSYRGTLIAPKLIFGGYSQIIGTRDLANEFEPSDPRLSKSLWLVGDMSMIYPTGTSRGYLANMARGVKTGNAIAGNYFHIKKGWGGDDQSTIGTNQGDDPTNWAIIRFSDVKLMYAEALAERDQNANTDAVKQLNDVRARARDGKVDILPDFPNQTKYGGNIYPSDGLPAFEGTEVTYTNDLDGFRKALVHERRVELAFEYHRYLDLIRWSKIPNHPGNADIVLKNNKTTPKSLEEDKKDNFNSTIHFIFPKPQVEVDRSKGSLKQNIQFR